MKILKLLFAVLLAGLCHAQDTRPKLELEPRINLNGGGYQLVSGSMSAGVGLERTHFNFHVAGTYDAARKIEWTPIKDNTNPHGNVESLSASVFGRTTGGYLVGCSGGYGRARTTLFTKTGYGVDCGGGRDFMHISCPMCRDYGSIRLTAEFGIFPLPGKADQEDGFTINLFAPSPAAGGHFFFHVRSFVGWISGKHDASTNIGLLMRF